jgi:hypothetical protein
MRRTLLAVVSVLAILGILAPAALAQAPAPKVTITGLFDQITSTGKNIYDGNFGVKGDDEWYARTRFRPDFAFEVGRTKAVLGLEIDFTFGDCGGPAGSSPPSCKGGSFGQGLDLNTDLAGAIEVKWIYTEFDLTGKDSLMPFIPVPTRARAGGQPFGTLANFKPTYANGDFAGLSTVTTFAPNFKMNLAYVQVEEEILATSGEDWAVIVSPEITIFKGLDIKPLYSYFYADGDTSTAARRVVRDANLLGGTPGGAGGSIGAATTSEDRHTVGIDMRWRSGPFSLDPTFMYQFGKRDATSVLGVTEEADISAWLLDIQGGWRAGPLLLEARFIWSPGNDATDDLTDEINYFEPLNLDTGYYAGWAQVFALGVDYFNGGGGTLNGMSTNIGYDRYGRLGGGLRATYSLTPKLAFWGIVSAFWTDEKVDTDTGITGGIRNAPVDGGDDRFIGWEPNLGLTYRFAANTAFDLVGAYFFAGDALNTPTGEAEDGWTAAARVRLSF